MNGDQFSKPLSARRPPDGVPAEVWASFADAGAARTAKERTEKWAYYLSVHAKYYDSTGNRKDAATSNTAQATLF